MKTVSSQKVDDDALNTSSSQLMSGISGIFKRLIRDDKSKNSPTKPASEALESIEKAKDMSLRR